SRRRAAEMPELAAASAASPPTTATTRRGGQCPADGLPHPVLPGLAAEQHGPLLRCGQPDASARRTASTSAALDIELRPAMSSSRARRSSSARVSPARSDERPPSLPGRPRAVAPLAGAEEAVPSLAGVLVRPVFAGAVVFVCRAVAFRPGPVALFLVAFLDGPAFRVDRPTVPAFLACGVAFPGAAGVPARSPVRPSAAPCGRSPGSGAPWPARRSA